jgi:excisionase family DNA binding protein
MEQRIQDYITVSQAAKKLGVSRQRVHALLQSQRLGEARWMGEFIVIPEAAVLGFKRKRPGRKATT